VWDSAATAAAAMEKHSISISGSNTWMAMLAIVTENELGLVFPLGTFPKNFVHIRPRFI